MPELVTKYESRRFTAELTSYKCRVQLCCFLCILTYAKFENDWGLHLPSRKAPKIVSVVCVANGNSTTTALVVLNNPEEF